MTGHDQSPLTRLVLVTAALAVAASCCAGLLVVVEQSHTNDVQAPENSNSQCMSHCKSVQDSCISQYCTQQGDFRSCQLRCQRAWYTCLTSCQ